MHNVFSDVKGDQNKRAIDRVNLHQEKALGMQLHIINHVGSILGKKEYRLHFVPVSTLLTDNCNDRLSKSFRSPPKFMRVVSVVTK